MASDIGVEEFGEMVEMVAKLDMAIPTAGRKSGCVALISLKAKGKLKGCNTSAVIRILTFRYADVWRMSVIAGT